MKILKLTEFGFNFIGMEEQLHLYHVSLAVSRFEILDGMLHPFLIHDLIFKD
jgi:hypothetical protein